MTFITATTLPLLIALAEIGQRDGVMLPATAAALVGAGVLSVLVYPLIAVGLHWSAPLTPADAGVAAMETATRTSGPQENPDLTDWGGELGSFSRDFALGSSDSGSIHTDPLS